MKLYENIFDDKKYEKKLNTLTRFRFNIAYILCLIRGINANYEEEIIFSKKGLTEVQNSGIFLLLNLILYSNYLANRV